MSFANLVGLNIKKFPLMSRGFEGDGDVTVDENVLRFLIE
jgi:hypothetical protein